MKEYIVNAEELEKLIEFYDIENRKELIGNDNSLKRERRSIYKFLESKKPVEIVAEGREIGVSSNTDWFMCFKVMKNLPK